MKTRRFSAYLIDFIILSVFLALITFIFNDHDNKIQKSINNLNNLVIEQEINFNEYIESYKILKYNYDKNNIFNLIMNIIISLILYVILPYKFNGQTIGMKITKIKIVSKMEKKPKLVNFFLRSLIVNFICLMLISLLLINILSVKYYFYVTFILTLLSFLLVIISVFMILYRHDEKGLQDILTKTKVIKK